MEAADRPADRGDQHASDVIADLLVGDRGYRVMQQLPGIGPVLARSSSPRSARSPGSVPQASPQDSSSAAVPSRTLQASRRLPTAGFAWRPVPAPPSPTTPARPSMQEQRL